MYKFLAILILIFSLSACTPAVKENKAPNIIYFFADDLGYGETGAYGQQKIQTPNIDQLARNGMRFTRHYSAAPVCAPARCMLLTGKHAGHAYIRGNDEWRARGEVWNYLKAIEDPNLEGQRPIPTGTVTLASLLKQAGYATGMVGKWGLGAPNTEGIPTKQGFDYFYGYNCQRQAHNLYPPFLWENENKVLLNNAVVPPGTKLDSLADPNHPESYQKYFQKDYAPKMMHDKALQFVRQQKESPFFLYYASPLPHLPLQIPQEYIDPYRELLGEEDPYIGDKGYFPCQHPRATYAAMITYLDTQLGELVAALKEIGQYENTIILFSSDNGPSYLGGVDAAFFDSAGPFSIAYGRTKGFVHEGGIRVPMIASWPNNIKANTISNHISAFYDVLPTICDLVDIPKPTDTDGMSFLPTLLGEKQEEHPYLYWEFPSYKGQQALRMGKWKGIRKNIFEGNMNLELYDLEQDSLEQHDLSSQHPEIVQQIDSLMQIAHEPAEIERFKIKELGDE